MINMYWFCFCLYLPLYSKRSLDIISAISDTVIDNIIEIFAKEISMLEEDIVKAAKTENEEKETGDIGFLGLPGIAAVTMIK